MSMDFDMKEGPRLRVILDNMEADVVAVVAASLRESLEEVKSVSQDQYCPVDTGYLRSTAYVTVDEWAGMAMVDIGYTAEYAAAVHEINKNYNGGKQWKYLETPLKEMTPQIQSKLYGDLNKWLDESAR